MKRNIVNFETNDTDSQREKTLQKKVWRTIMIISWLILLIIVVSIVTCNKAMAQHDQFRSDTMPGVDRPQRVGIMKSVYAKRAADSTLKARKWTVALLSYDNGRIDTVHCLGVKVGKREMHQDTVKLKFPKYNMDLIRQGTLIGDTTAWSAWDKDTLKMNHYYIKQPKKKTTPKANDY